MYVRESTQHPGRIICACEECGLEFLCWKTRPQKYCSREHWKQATIVDLTGQKFFRLTVLERDWSRPSTKGGIYWRCLCDCGTVTSVQSPDLRKQQTKSCGCWMREACGDRFRTHGKTNTREHRIWNNMLDRCYNTKSKDYPRYGARGIKVCSRWKNSFSNFLIDMGQAPSEQYSIHRIDNYRGYEPSNCIWVTAKVQNNNKTNSISITFQGETLSLEQWGNKFNIKRGTLWKRLYKYRWSVEQALSTPIDTTKWPKHLRD